MLISPLHQISSVPVYPIEWESLSCIVSINRTNRKGATQGLYVSSWNLTKQCRTIITDEAINYTVIKNMEIES